MILTSFIDLSLNDFQLSFLSGVDFFFNLDLYLFLSLLYGTQVYSFAAIPANCQLCLFLSALGAKKPPLGFNNRLLHSFYLKWNVLKGFNLTNFGFFKPFFQFFDNYSHYSGFLRFKGQQTSDNKILNFFLQGSSFQFFNISNVGNFFEIFCRFLGFSSLKIRRMLLQGLTID